MKPNKSNTMNKFAWIFFAVVLFASCQNTSNNITDKAGNPIAIETLTAQQLGVSDSSLNYIFYLPRNYNGVEKLPIVFFLDPHANGKLPLTAYAELATKYGYVFVASNNIKNGQTADYTLHVFKKLIAETKHRFVIDEKRMFVAGFSGGAKLAIIFTQQIPEIIGVAACGASMPLVADYKPNYYYAGIVGNEDFNYLETNQTFSIFEQRSYDYTSEIFDGGHAWPPVKSFEMALIGFEIYAMKLKRTEINEEWLSQIEQKMNDSISLFEKTGQALKQNIYIRQSARWFYGLQNTKELNNQAIKVETSAAFINQVKKQQKLIQTEVKLRAEYIRAIELRDKEWWMQEVESINKSINQSDKELAQVSKRLLNYLSMVSFMLVKTDLEDSRFDNALKKLAIYEGVDPKNPDVYLMYARYYMQMGDSEKMKENFTKAQQLGFNDYETYKNEQFWKALFENEGIIALQ
jgi:hypothetical protein